MEREVSQKMLGAGACIDIEKLRTMKSMGKLRVGGTKLVEGEGKVYGGSLRLVIELTLGGEGRAFLLRREHQHALQQIYIGNFISNHQWIKIIPYTQQKSINQQPLRTTSPPARHSTPYTRPSVNDPAPQIPLIPSLSVPWLRHAERSREYQKLRFLSDQCSTISMGLEVEEIIREVCCFEESACLGLGRASMGRSAMTCCNTSRVQERLLQQGLSSILQELRQEFLLLMVELRGGRSLFQLRSAPNVELISSVIISSSLFPRTFLSTSSETLLRLNSTNTTTPPKRKQMTLQAVKESSAGSLEGKISLTVRAQSEANWCSTRARAMAWEMKELSLWSQTWGWRVKQRKMILLVRKRERREKKVSRQKRGMAVEKKRQKQTAFSCTEQQNYQQNSMSRMRLFMIFCVEACLAHSDLTLCIAHSSITYSHGNTFSVRKKLASSSLPISMYHFLLHSPYTYRLLFTASSGMERCAHLTREKEPPAQLASARMRRVRREELTRQVRKMLMIMNLRFSGRVRNRRSSVILNTILMRNKVTPATTKARVPTQIQCCQNRLKYSAHNSQYRHWKVLQVSEEQKANTSAVSLDFCASMKVTFWAEGASVRGSSPLVMPLAWRLSMKMPKRVARRRAATMSPKQQLRRYSLWSLRWQFSQIMLSGSTRHFLTLMALPSRLRFMLRRLYLQSPCTRWASSWSSKLTKALMRGKGLPSPSSLIDRQAALILRYRSQIWSYCLSLRRGSSCCPYCSMSWRRSVRSSRKSPQSRTYSIWWTGPNWEKWSRRRSSGVLGGSSTRRVWQLGGAFLLRSSATQSLLLIFQKMRKARRMQEQRRSLRMMMSWLNFTSRALPTCAYRLTDSAPSSTDSWFASEKRITRCSHESPYSDSPFPRQFTTSDGRTATESTRNTTASCLTIAKYSFTPGPNFEYSSTPRREKGWVRREWRLRCACARAQAGGSGCSVRLMRRLSSSLFLPAFMGYA